MQQVETTASAAAWASLVGGALWAVTPLRDLVLGAGEDPRDGVGAFRAYNAYVLVAVVLMSTGLVALLRRRPGTALGKGHGAAVGTVLTGHAVLAAGSLLAVLLGDRARGLVMAGQDLGFLAAVLALAGATALGILGLRRSTLPRPAALLFAAALPLGLVASVVLAVSGAPEDLVGLPTTVLYGGAFAALGTSRMAAGRTPPVDARTGS